MHPDHEHWLQERERERESALAAPSGSALCSYCGHVGRNPCGACVVEAREILKLHEALCKEEQHWKGIEKYGYDPTP
jgi:hypothetical protein